MLANLVGTRQKYGTGEVQFVLTMTAWFDKNKSSKHNLEAMRYASMCGSGWDDTEYRGPKEQGPFLYQLRARHLTS